LGWKIDRLLDKPGRLAQLQANAQRLGRPRAALDVVQTLMSLP
jgi:processive 1,2-diacylglycerol beta-glucosyltransferase